MRFRIPRSLPLLALLLTLGAWPTLAAAQNFGFEPPTEASDPALPEALRDLAERVLPVYEENDPDRYFSTLAALQMAVGDPAAARTSRAALRERLQSEQSSLPPGRAIVYDIYVGARALEATENVPFETAYTQTFNETMGALDDLAAYDVEVWFLASTEPSRESFQNALDRQRGQTSITLEEALELVQAWFAFEAYRSSQSLVRPLLAEENARRYVVEELAIPVAQDANADAPADLGTVEHACDVVNARHGVLIYGQDDIAGQDFDLRLAGPGVEIFGINARPGFQIIDSLQPWDVHQHAARDDAVLEVEDGTLRAARFVDLRHRHAVVHESLVRPVAEGIHVGVDEPVVRDRQAVGRA